MKTSLLLIIPSINYGGAEMQLIQQLKWLEQNGWKTCIAIVSSSNNTKLLNELEISSEKILILNSPEATLSFKAIFFAIKNQYKLARFARALNVNKIIAHLPISHFWGRLLKLKKPDARLIIYHHSMQYQANPLNTYPKKVFNSFQKVLAEKTDDVSICISESVKQNIEAHFKLVNPVVLYNAVHDRYKIITSSDKRIETSRNSSSIKIIIPGRLHPAKGHLFFLKIFEQLRHKFSLQLIIAGGGSLEKTIIEYLMESNMANCVTITGFLSNDQLLHEISSANFVLIPSISEGLGIVGIEALMLGKTVIASDAGGLKEVFRHKENGYLFKAGNSASCLNVVQKVLSNYPNSLLPERILRKDFETRFSFETHMKKFESIIKNENYN